MRIHPLWLASIVSAAFSCGDSNTPGDMTKATTTPMGMKSPVSAEAAGGSGPAAATTGGVKLDPRCPTTPIEVGGSPITLNGCCTSDNHCGADSSMVQMGCQDLANAMFRMFAPMAPAPRTCDGMPLTSAGGMATAGTAAGAPATSSMSASAGTKAPSGGAAGGTVSSGRGGGNAASTSTAAAGAAASSAGGKCPSGFECQANPIGMPAMVCKMPGAQTPPMCTTAADCASLGSTLCMDTGFNFSVCVLACS